MKKKTYKIIQNNITVFEFTVTYPDDTKTYLYPKWDSKTGLVTAEVDGKRIPLETSGVTTGTLEPAPFEAINVEAMDYNYWYY